MTPALDPPFRDLEFMAPMSTQRAAGLARFLSDAGRGTVVDFGCGWAELLLRTVEQSESLVGFGVDCDAEAIEEGRSRAAARGLAERVTLTVGDDPTSVPTAAPAGLISIGASHVWRQDHDDHRLPYRSALEGMRALVDRGARVVYGDGIWSHPPTAEAVEALGGSDDELVDLETMVEYAETAGFMAVAVEEASQEEWDRFESGYCACYARWIAEHDVDHVDAPQVRAASRDQRRRYLRGYRGVLGHAYLQLVAV